MKKTFITRCAEAVEKPFQLRLMPGDMIVHARPGFLGMSGNSGILDFWCFSGGEHFRVSGQSDDFPPGFKLHPTEVGGELALKRSEEETVDFAQVFFEAPMGSPHLWRVQVGDHIILVGERPHNPGMILAFDFFFGECMLAWWLLPDGSQPMLEQAVGRRDFKNDPQVKAYLQLAAKTFASAEPPQSLGMEWIISH